MLLFIDVGNSNIIFCLYNIIKKKFFIKFKTNTFNYLKIKQILYNIKHSYIISNNIIISSVVPNINNYLLININIYFKNSIINFFCNENYNLFLKTLYDNNIGNDRIINCIGAIEKFPNKNLLIIDIGTMITFDVITIDKIHLGGVIFPGINTILKTIFKNSSQINNDNIISYSALKNIVNLSCIQTSTINNINSGIYNGYIGVLKEIINNISIKLNQDFFVIGTGGDSYLFKNNNIFNVIDNNLLFFGLLKFYKKCIQ